MAFPVGRRRRKKCRTLWKEALVYNSSRSMPNKSSNGYSGSAVMSFGHLFRLVVRHSLTRSRCCCSGLNHQLGRLSVHLRGECWTSVVSGTRQNPAASKSGRLGRRRSCRVGRRPGDLRTGPSTSVDRRRRHKPRPQLPAYHCVNKGVQLNNHKPHQFNCHWSDNLCKWFAKRVTPLYPFGDAVNRQAT